MTTLYVAVIEVDERWIDEQDGPIEDLKKYLDRKIKVGLGLRGRIRGSEVERGKSQWDQLRKKHTHAGSP